jgi:hypothetical protein
MDDLSNTAIFRPKRQKPFFPLQTMVVRSSVLKGLAPLFFFAVLIGCQMGKDSTALSVEELTGVWQTTEPRYEDCSFEIQGDSILFTNDLSEVHINHINDIEKVSDGKGTLYHILYKDDEGQKYKLSLLYFKSPDGDIIKFKNQQDIEWKRRPENTFFLE